MFSQRISVSLGQSTLRLFTHPGLPAWDVVYPSELLIVENAPLQPADSVLVFGCYQGALAVHLAQALEPGRLAVIDHDLTAIEVTRQSLEANDIASPAVSLVSVIELPTEYLAKYDIAIIHLPKGRLLARRLLLQAYSALRPGGTLLLAGSNNLGVRPAAEDARELVGAGRVVAYKKGNRLIEWQKPSAQQPLPGWANEPGVAPHSWIEFSAAIGHETYPIRSLPGVFSHDHLDEGTLMLLTRLNIPAGATVLDMGCGYGIIGLYAASHGAQLVHLTDNNLLAVLSSRESLALNGVRNAMVYGGDLFSPLGETKYDLVLSNPPFHAGRAVDYEITERLIAQSFQALHYGGQLVIVANRFIRYDRLIEKIFNNVAVIASSPKFHVLSGLK